MLMPDNDVRAHVTMVTVDAQVAEMRVRAQLFVRLQADVHGQVCIVC